MKKYAWIIISTILAVGCDDFLKTTNFMEKSDQNFPENVSDCYQQLTGVYNGLNKTISGSCPYIIGDLISDDMYSGGSATDFTAHGFDQWRKSNPNMVESVWNSYYSAIYRANKLLEAADKIAFTNENDKKQILGECYFLRAYFYSELSKLFGRVPLLIKSDPVNISRSPIDEVYSQIASDLKSAIDNLPAVIPATVNNGHATKWAAEALLGRVYLFYSGYYKKETLPLVGGGSISKDQIVGYINDLIANSGHGLVNDFRNLWAYTNNLTVGDYPYTKNAISVDGLPLLWAGEGNKETIFAVNFGQGVGENNVSLYFGLRGQNYNEVFPFGYGYGQGTINPNLIKQWLREEPKDTIRLWGSVTDVQNPREGIFNYKINGWGYIEETRLFDKKASIYYAFTSKTGERKAWKTQNFQVISDGIPTGNANSSFVDLILIRYADVLLMHSELTGTVDNLNKVRARAGLPPIATYSLAALQTERRHELAFEGLRYYDLLRWFGPETTGDIIDINQQGGDMLNSKVPSKYNQSVTDRLKATGGFMQIPENQILLSNGVLKQNPGWDVGSELQ